MILILHERRMSKLTYGKGHVVVDPRTCGPPELYNGDGSLGSIVDPCSSKVQQCGVSKLSRSKTMIVKVQTPEDVKIVHDGIDDYLMVYNEKHDVHLLVSSKKCAQYAAIVKSVADKGIVGRKAYFPARLAPDGLLTINYLEHLAPQNW
eukprot:CAMPEP_0179443336 /NCGR_PEP_ID=MMETSP0799-20121207/26767_1 /TAXON_ID=46947 /ORGANISM="Geminigera cryophila, Strain CCMP2564" /LENGTH=148 /DNA_ID=CAMNT_0021229247 /DNA_START=302 /DNA_END=745 /DNA_ORIENTATION=-